MRLASLTLRAMLCWPRANTKSRSEMRRPIRWLPRGVGMSPAEVEVSLVQDTLPFPPLMTAEALQQSSALQYERLVSAASAPASQRGPRRTPRKSFIVVLPEDHVVSPDLVREKLPAQHDDEEMDVILACAGQSTSIAALKRQVRDLWVLQAPAGTSTEDLRELAMSQAPGDIVTMLLCGTPGCA